MIKIQIKGRNYELTDNVKAYVNKKIGRLDKYLPRGHKPTSCEVEIFDDPSGREGNNFVCTAVVMVPKATLQASEATATPHASVDIVEAKLRQQMQKYKAKHAPSKFRLKEWLLRRVENEEAAKAKTIDK